MILIGYYYCSLNTFLNILKNKQIYLSDPLKMNDYFEIKWYLERLNSDKININGFESLFDILKSRSNIDFTFQELVESLNINGQNSIYISCFSKQPDILSQWRAYAEDGRGVAIGFELDDLKIADNFMVENVIYVNNVDYDDTETDVECVADTMNIVLTENNITTKEQQIEAFLNELIPVLAKYKNPAFAEEQEIRLIYCDDMKLEKIINSYGAFEDGWYSKELEHDFRVVGDNNITEFVKLSFDVSSVKQIYIGPKCLLSENDVKNIVKRLLNTDIKVKKSKSSYR